MRREQRKQERERLKSIDMDILRAAMVLHSLLADRYKFDPVNTGVLIIGIVDQLEGISAGHAKEGV